MTNIWWEKSCRPILIDLSVLHLIIVWWFCQLVRKTLIWSIIDKRSISLKTKQNKTLFDFVRVEDIVFKIFQEKPSKWYKDFLNHQRRRREGKHIRLWLIKCQNFIKNLNKSKIYSNSKKIDRIMLIIIQFPSRVNTNWGKSSTNFGKLCNIFFKQS